MRLVTGHIDSEPGHATAGIIFFFYGNYNKNKIDVAIVPRVPYPTFNLTKAGLADITRWTDQAFPWLILSYSWTTHGATHREDKMFYMCFDRSG